MIVDGRAIAGEIIASTRERVAAFGRALRLVAIAADGSAATASYLRIKKVQALKAGIEMQVVDLAADAKGLYIAASVTAAAEAADAVIVQLPLPAGVEAKTVLNAIPLDKDADVLSDAARTRFNHGAFMHPEPMLPPVVAAMKTILERAGAGVNGARAVVVGNGWLVGEPCAAWLTQQGAAVTVLTRESADFAQALAAADLIVSGAGSPGLIKPGMVKQGVIIIDAGTSESNGAIVGDADPACAGVASVFTPVPGGVGPVAVACLFQNAITLAERAAAARPGR
ncbi:MAG TPA: bifunctional 5,10-methylenetetrahydrofolate dehydrogenase/5,10-methenyltetrahydrofolate cyclohydrolase [Candidatus Paceibacterota bacterium]